jgi:hypothetical protein
VSGWNCFRAYILDWHDHSRDSCEAPRIDHALKDQLNLFHPHAQRSAFRRCDARQQRRLFARWNQSPPRSPQRSARLKPSSALNQVNDHYDKGNYEQEMDQTAADVDKQAQKPEHD